MKRYSLPLMMCGTILALLLAACARQPQPASLEEIAFQSGEFNIVGNLRTPAGTGPFPVVLFVHGSREADRNDNTPTYESGALGFRCVVLPGN